MNNTSVNLFNNGVVKIIPPKMAKKKLIKLAIFIPPILAFFKPPLTPGELVRDASRGGQA